MTKDRVKSALEGLLLIAFFLTAASISIRDEVISMVGAVLLVSFGLSWLLVDWRMDE